MQSYNDLVVHRQRQRELHQAADLARLVRQARRLRGERIQRNPALSWRLYRIISLFLAV